jgi:hypothetical protein
MFAIRGLERPRAIAAVPIAVHFTTDSFQKTSAKLGPISSGEPLRNFLWSSQDSWQDSWHDTASNSLTRTCLTDDKIFRSPGGPIDIRARIGCRPMFGKVQRMHDE